MMDVIERGAHTITMPDGTGFAIAIADYPDQNERTVSLIRVEADGFTDKTLFEHNEPLT